LHYLTLSNKEYADSPLTGAHRTFAELVKALLAQGNEVVLLGPSLPPDVAPRDVQFLHVKPTRFLSNLLPIFIRQAARALKTALGNWRFLRRPRPDAIIVVGMTNGLAALPLKWLLGCPLLMLLPEAPQEYRALRLQNGLTLASRHVVRAAWVVRLYRKVFALFERALLLHTDAVIVQCHRYRQTLAERYPGRSERFFVLPSSVETSWVEPRWQSANRSVQARRLGFVGSLEHRKGVQYLIDAFKELATRHCDVTLEIAGAGSLSDELRAVVEADRRLRGRIVLHGWMPAPFEFIAGCDLVLVPSLSDSQPRVIGEALYAGTPVLGSRVGGIPEQLHYDELLFEPGSAGAIVEALEPIVESRERYSRIRELCAMRRAALSFDWAARLHALLEQVLGEKPGEYA